MPGRDGRTTTRGGLRVAALVGALLGLGAPGAHAAPGPAAAAAAPADPAFFAPGVRTRFTFVDVAVTVRSRPSWDARHVGRLRARTPDRTDEVVLVHERQLDRDGREWLRVGLPVLPNGTTGWAPASAFGPLRFSEQWLKIDRKALRLTLIERGRVRMVARIGIGRPEWPTPAGDFVLRSRLSGKRLGAIYGPLALGTSARSAVLTDWPGGGFIGIHGTDQPGLLPGRVSHGCIRLRNEDVLRLGRLVRVGTPVSVR